MAALKYLLFLVFGTVVSGFLAGKNLYLTIANDANYPQFIRITNLNYQLYGSRVVASFVMTVHEEINEGTSMLLVVSPEFPYSRLINNLDMNLCTFTRRDLPFYGSMVDASGNTLPDRCPIKPGTYNINKMKIDLDKWPLLLRGFDVGASFTIHKNGRILSKINMQASLK